MEETNTKTYQVDFFAERPFHFANLSDHRLGNQRDYHQRSEIFPSQTAMMGTLRRLLLCTEGEVDVNQRDIPESDKIKALIGPANWHECISSSPFGIIQGISPALLVHEDKELAFCPHQYPHEGCYQMQHLKATSAGHKVSYPLHGDSKTQQQTHELGTISTKVFTKETFVNIKNTFEHFAKEDLLFSATRPHVDASRTKADDQEGYFITERYDFKTPSKTHYRCYIRLANTKDLSQTLTGYKMPLGGNDNAFYVEVKECDISSHILILDENNQEEKKQANTVQESDEQIYGNEITLVTKSAEQQVVVLLSPCPLPTYYRQQTLRAAVEPYLHTFAKRTAKFSIAEKPDFNNDAPLWANRGSTFWVDKDKDLVSDKLTRTERMLGFGVSVVLNTPKLVSSN